LGKNISQHDEKEKDEMENSMSKGGAAGENENKKKETTGEIVGKKKREICASGALLIF